MSKHLTLLLFIGLVWGQTDLSIKKEAVLNAKGDAKKWLAYPPLALISAGFIYHNPRTQPRTYMD